MPIENTSKFASSVLLVSGGLLLLILHLFALYAVPGFHFDEAWAMNHAVKIMGGEFTFSGMSPYTAPWTHYFAALWMKLFGVGVFPFRFSQIFLALLGIGLMQFSLWKKDIPGWPIFLFVVALSPGLIMNHRFAVELNGFHVFCFGLLLFSLQSNRVPLAAFAWLMGSTAHILFYGIGLAIFAVCLWEKREFSRKEKIWGSVASLLLALFFTRVYLEIPEKGKVLALLGSAILVISLLWIPLHRWNWQKSWFEGLVWLVAAVFLANAFFFLEGFWQLSISSGKEAWRGGRIVSLCLFLGFSIFFFMRGLKAFPRLWRRAFLLGVICLGLMMLKQTPRYHELILLSLTVILSVGIGSLRLVPKAACLGFLVLHGALIYAEYFTLNPKETELRFLLFKDSSRDFLSKQELVSVLGSSGCRLSDIKTGDSRVGEALLALSHGDWPVADKPCAWKNLQLERRAESFRAGAKLEVADFVIWENP
jgi:hypothetical protein